VTTDPAVSNAHTRVRLTTRSMPHSCWRSTTTRIAAGKNACAASWIAGTIPGSTIAIASGSGSASGTNDSVISPEPSASQPRPRRAVSGPRSQRRVASAAASAPSTNTVPIWSVSDPATDASQAGMSTIGPSGTNTRAAVIATHAAAPVQTAARVVGDRAPSRTSHGTTTISPTVPGTQATEVSSDTASAPGSGSPCTVTRA
jgi:hypothetical protein